MTLAILAHQGGWDEILLVAGPIVVIFAVLGVAKRRADAINVDETSTDGSSPSTS